MAAGNSDAYYDFPVHKLHRAFSRPLKGCMNTHGRGEALSLNECPVSLHAPLPKLLDFPAKQSHQLGVFILFNRLRSVL